MSKNVGMNDSASWSSMSSLGRCPSRSATGSAAFKRSWLLGGAVASASGGGRIVVCRVRLYGSRGSITGIVAREYASEARSSAGEDAGGGSSGSSVTRCDGGGGSLSKGELRSEIDRHRVPVVVVFFLRFSAIVRRWCRG